MRAHEIFRSPGGVSRLPTSTSGSKSTNDTARCVVVPLDIFRGALNYIQHVGANHVMRGEPHPQQWIVDGLLAAAPKQNAAPQGLAGSTVEAGSGVRQHHVSPVPAEPAAQPEAGSDDAARFRWYFGAEKTGRQAQRLALLPIQTRLANKQCTLDDYRQIIDDAMSDATEGQGK